MGYFEECLKLFKVMHGPASIYLSDVKDSIAIARAKSRYEGKEVGCKEIVESFRELYLHYETQKRGDTPHAILADVNLADALKRAHHGIEAERLLGHFLAN